MNIKFLKNVNKFIELKKDIIKLGFFAFLILTAVFGLIFRPIATNMRDELKNETIVTVPFARNDLSGDLEEVKKIASNVLDADFSARQSKTEQGRELSYEIVLESKGTKKFSDQKMGDFLEQLKLNFPDDVVLQRTNGLEVLNRYKPALSFKFLGCCFLAALITIVLTSLYALMKFKKIKKEYAVIKLTTNLLLDLVIGIGMLFLFGIASLNVAIVVIMLIICFSLNSYFLVLNEIEKNLKNSEVNLRTAQKNATEKFRGYFFNSSIFVLFATLVVLICGLIFGSFLFLASCLIPVAAAMLFDLNFPELSTLDFNSFLNFKKFTANVLKPKKKTKSK